jgi:hypothetical protein
MANMCLLLAEKEASASGTCNTRAPKASGSASSRFTTIPGKEEGMPRQNKVVSGF